MENWLVPGLVIGGVLLVLVVVVVLLVAVVGGVLFARRKRVDPNARANALEGLGYRPVKPGQWSRSIQGTAMTFDDKPAGLRWTVRLPRYNTMTLVILENTNPDVSKLDGVFSAGDPELDGRFAMASGLAARTQALVTNRQLRNALLAMPNLALELSADELVIEDPGQEGLKALKKGAADNTDEAVDAELQVHGSVAALVNTFFRCMYNEAGTVFDEHR